MFDFLDDMVGSIAKSASAWFGGERQAEPAPSAHEQPPAATGGEVAPGDAAQASRVARELVDAMDGFGTDEEAIRRTLGGIADPAQRRQVSAEVQRRTGQSLDAMLQDELSGSDLEEAELLMQGRTADAGAAGIEAALLGGLFGPDEDAVFDRLQGKGDWERRELVAHYNQRFGAGRGGYDFDDALSSMELIDQARTRQLVDHGQLDPAMALHGAMEGLGTDEELIKRTLRGLDPDQARDLSARYDQFGRLEEDLASELSGGDRLEVHQLLEAAGRRR